VANTVFNLFFIFLILREIHYTYISRKSSKLSHRLTYDIRHSFIESIWEDHIFCRIFHIARKCLCSRDLHLIGDRFFAVFQYSFEYPWECEDIVHLIRIVRATSTDDTYSCFFRYFWHDLRSGIRHGKYYSITHHSHSHIFSESSCCRHSDKYIGSHHRICESTRLPFEVREF
jgi:hypothetical protein